MIIDGEKWACEACVRGHRVSNCQHSSRPLQHINKKGRPVSQCQHCRSMRKARASHVKCDCGEKTHKCAHLQATVEGHRESCCCNHGGRCTCSHKKEPVQLDPVPESESDKEASPSPKASSPKAGVRRRRANTSQSEGSSLTFDDRGHHKPTYKHSRASQKSNPYQLGRVNSLHISSSSSNRSADNLGQGGSRSAKDKTGSAAAAQKPRRVRSETASPLLAGAAVDQLNSQLPPLDLSAIEYPAYVPNSFDMFGSLSENDPALFSAGLSATPVDWSHYDLDFSTSRTADNFAPSNYSQPQSFGGYEYNGSEQAPTLATTTSGDPSEADDFLSNFDDFDGSTFGTSTASGGYNLTAARSYSGTDLGRHIDADNLRFMKARNKFLPTPASLAGEEPSLVPVTSASYSYPTDDQGLWMSDYAHGLPALTDSPGPNMASFWDGQQ